MSIQRINEAFKRTYAGVLAEAVEPSYKEQLRKALVLRSMNVVANGGNIKDLEIALQAVIEEFFPDKSWWEVTDCNIFMELLGGTSPRAVCDVIIDLMKDDCCDEDDSPKFVDTRKQAIISGDPSMDAGFDLYESVDEVRAIKDFIQAQFSRKVPMSQNNAFFAEWLAEAPDAHWSYDRIAEVAYLMGYDVYETSHGYFDSHDYLIVRPGMNPDIYISDLNDDDTEFWEVTKSDLRKVGSFGESASSERPLRKVDKNTRISKIGK